MARQFLRGHQGLSRCGSRWQNNNVFFLGWLTDVFCQMPEVIKIFRLSQIKQPGISIPRGDRSWVSLFYVCLQAPRSTHELYSVMLLPSFPPSKKLYFSLYFEKEIQISNQFCHVLTLLKAGWHIYHSKGVKICPAEGEIYGCNFAEGSLWCSKLQEWSMKSLLKP